MNTSYSPNDGLAIRLKAIGATMLLVGDGGTALSSASPPEPMLNKPIGFHSLMTSLKAYSCLEYWLQSFGNPMLLANTSSLGDVHKQKIALHGNFDLIGLH